MPKISTDKAVKGAIAIKQLSRIIKETENEELIKAYTVLHERMKRYGEENHPDVVILGGDT